MDDEQHSRASPATGGRRRAPSHGKGHSAGWARCDDCRVWSKDEVRRIARSLLPDEAAEAAVDAIRPGWRLEACPDAAPASVRVGGPATLSKGEVWPRNAREIPLTFLCEIDLRRLPPLPCEWADRVSVPTDAGVLRLFADLVDDPYTPRVLISPLPGGEAHRASMPAVADPLPSGGPRDTAAAEHRVGVLPEIGAQAVPFLTLPEWRPGTEWEQDKAWRDLGYLVRVERELAWLRDPMRRGPDPWSISHVLGEPTSVQDDVRLAGRRDHDPDPDLRDPAAWSVLVALHSDHRLSIVDGGAYHVLLPSRDLDAQRWDRAVLDISSM